MNTTKQKRRYAIDLPEDVMNVLLWHVDTQLTAPEQRESELLFPATTGGFRGPNLLNKPFAECRITTRRVASEEQRVSVARVISLFEATQTEPGGAPSGAPTPEGGAPRKKAG